MKEKPSFEPSKTITEAMRRLRESDPRIDASIKKAEEDRARFLSTGTNTAGARKTLRPRKSISDVLVKPPTTPVTETDQKELFIDTDGSFVQKKID